MAQDFTNDPLDSCISTVPDYFTQEQRELVRQILNLAGCSEAHVISNSIAGILFFTYFYIFFKTVAIDYSRNIAKSETVLFLESGSQGNNN